MTRSAEDLLKQWLVRKNLDKTMDYFAAECLDCVKVHIEENETPPSTEQEALQLLRGGLEKASMAAGSVKSLGEAIAAAEPHHEDIRLVKHRDEGAFVIAAIPDSMGIAAGCDRRKQDREPDSRGSDAKGYGAYYATGFTLGRAKANPGVLWLVWAKRSQGWKVVSYTLITP
jgi:hypothetical protein